MFTSGCGVVHTGDAALPSIGTMTHALGRALTGNRWAGLLCGVLAAFNSRLIRQHVGRQSCVNALRQRREHDVDDSRRIDEKDEALFRELDVPDLAARAAELELREGALERAPEVCDRLEELAAVLGLARRARRNGTGRRRRRRDGRRAVGGRVIMLPRWTPPSRRLSCLQVAIDNRIREVKLAAETLGSPL